jgi:hypothetical protein
MTIADYDLRIGRLIFMGEKAYLSYWELWLDVVWVVWVGHLEVGSVWTGICGGR